MNPNTTNIILNDTQLVLHGIEQLAIVGIVLIVATLLLRKRGDISSNLKTLVWLLLGLWSVAMVFQYVISSYNYLHYVRPLQRQVQRQNTGL